MNSFRQVDLPTEIPGHLYLFHLPGLPGEPFNDFILDCKEAVVSLIVCLVEPHELADYGGAYWEAICEDRVGIRHVSHPVPDGGVTDDPEAYTELVVDVANRIRKGRAVLIHCLGGIGRTGTFAAAVLLELGLSLDEAIERIREAGSGPETEQQEEFLQSLAE